MAQQSPSAVSSTTFKIVKKGYDPDEVRAYLREVAGALQTAQDHAANVEARARQAVARAQEAAKEAEARAAAQPVAPARLDDTETISRTLLLAQKTADETVATAAREAEQIRSEAAREAGELRAAARAEVAQASEAARAEARKATEGERQRVESELQQLLARLEFLRDDVTQMEAHAAHHRERLLQVADDLQQLAIRPAAGLGDMRRPVLSAAADLHPADLAATQPVPVVVAEPEPEPEPEPVAPVAVAVDEVDPEPESRPSERPAPARLFETAAARADDPDITAEVPVVE